MTTEEKLDAIAEDAQIDVSTWYGKFVLLQLIMFAIDKDKADKFIDDTFDVLEDEIEDAYQYFINGV